MVECFSPNKGINCAKNRHRNQQLKLNMFVASLFQLQVSISYTVVFSSIYLFVTSPTVSVEPFCEHHNNSAVQESVTDQQHSWPGLGESDFFYSLISAARGIGLLVGSIVAGFLPAFVPFRLLMLLFPLVSLVGNVLYANATKGWMILVAQFLGQGLSLGMFYVFFLSYVSKTCIFIEESEQITVEELDFRRTKSKNGRHYSLKDKFLTMNLLLKNIGMPIGVGISSVMAQFEQTIDEFRWPGWAIVFILVVFSLLFQLVYREVDTDPKEGVPKGCCLTFHKPGLSLRGSKKCCSSRRPLCFRNAVVYTYLGYTGFVSYSLFTALDTLLSPALSDHFGFSILYTSYFTLGIMVIAFGASLVLVSLKSLRANNRIVLITSLVMSLLGAMLSADWQAIGQDPCHLQLTHAQISNSSIYSMGDSNSPSFVNGTPLHLVNTSNNYDEIDPAISNISNLADICTAGSSDTHECYWNPDSRITGTVCSLCRQVCRTVSMSVTFVQFSLGIGLISVSSLIMWTALLGVATDCTAKNVQSMVIGMLYTSASVSWTTTPLWCIWIYDFVGKHTLGPMAIWIMLILLSLVGCFILYKQLGPMNVSNRMKRCEDNKLETTQ